MGKKIIYVIIITCLHTSCVPGGEGLIDLLGGFESDAVIGVDVLHGKFSTNLHEPNSIQLSMLDEEILSIRIQPHLNYVRLHECLEEEDRFIGLLWEGRHNYMMILDQNDNLTFYSNYAIEALDFTQNEEAIVGDYLVFSLRQNGQRFAWRPFPMRITEDKALMVDIEHLWNGSEYFDLRNAVFNKRLFRELPSTLGTWQAQDELQWEVLDAENSALWEGVMSSGRFFYATQKEVNDRFFGIQLSATSTIFQESIAGRYLCTWISKEEEVSLYEVHFDPSIEEVIFTPFPIALPENSTLKFNQGENITELRFFSEDNLTSLPVFKNENDAEILALSLDFDTILILPFPLDDAPNIDLKMAIGIRP